MSYWTAFSSLETSCLFWIDVCPMKCSEERILKKFSKYWGANKRGSENQKGGFHVPETQTQLEAWDAF